MTNKRLSRNHLRAWRALLRAQAAVVRRIAVELEEADALPLETYDALLELFEAPEHRLRLRELGERVVLTRSGISRLVSRLERGGLVRREADASDARGIQARLTPKGERAFRETWPHYADSIRRHFAGAMTATDAKRLAETLEPLVGRNP